MVLILFSHEKEHGIHLSWKNAVLNNRNLYQLSRRST